MRVVGIIAALGLCATATHASAQDLRPTPQRPSGPGDITHQMPRIERGQMVDPNAVAPVQRQPNIIDKAVNTWNNAPVRPNINSNTSPPTPTIEYNKRF